MYKYSIIKVLKTFNEDELKEFDKFVRSPFFGGSEYLGNFYKAVKKYYPEFDQSGLEKTKIFAKLYPEKKFDDTVIRKLSSELLKLAEEYIKYLGSRQYMYLDHKLKLTGLREKKLNNLFEKAWKEAEEEVEKDDPLNFGVLFYRHFIQIELINYNIESGDPHFNRETYLHLGEYIMLYSLIIISQSVMNNAIVTDLYNAKIDNNILDDFISNFNFEEFLSKAGKRNNKFFINVEMHYYMMMMYKQPDNPAYFNKYRELLYSRVKKINKFVRFNLYGFLINNAYLRIQLGQTQYYAEMLSILKKMLEGKFLTDPYKNHMGNNHFRLIALTAANVGDLAWLEKFIEDNIKHIAPESRESMYSFAKGVLLFEQKEYEEALEHFNKVQYELIALKFDLKEYMLKIYYELWYPDTAASSVEAFKSFINKNKFSSEIRKGNLQKFLKYYQRLSKIKEKRSYHEIKNLRKEMEPESFSSKEWVIKKLAGLEKASKAR